MNRKILHIIFFIIIICFAVSCNKKGAQYPSNKVVSKDSTEIKLQGYNQSLIKREDSLLMSLLTSQTQRFEKSKVGFWYYVQKKTNQSYLINDSVIKISYKAYDMQGNLLKQETDKTIHFGKKEVPIGLEEGLKLMRKNEITRFIIPWYIAYGAQGTDEIPPYTSLTFIVEAVK